MTIARRLSPQMVRKTADCQEISSCSTHSQQDCRTTQHQTKTTTTIKRRRSVTFQQNNSLTPSADACYALSNEVKNELWWTPEELKEISISRKALVKQFIAGNNQQRRTNKSSNDHDDDENGSRDSVEQKFAALYKSCAVMNVSQVLRSKANKQLLSEVTSTGEGLRGLESKLSRTVCRHRKLHVQSVLSIVGQGRRSSMCSSDGFFSVNAAQSSRTSEILARVLAQIDAKEGMMQYYY